MACRHGALASGRHACSPDAMRRESMPPDVFQLLVGQPQPSFSGRFRSISGIQRGGRPNCLQYSRPSLNSTMCRLSWSPGMRRVLNGCLSSNPGRAGRPILYPSSQPSETGGFPGIVVSAGDGGGDIVTVTRFLETTCGVVGDSPGIPVTLGRGFTM